jgi:hypothetical protein
MEVAERARKRDHNVSAPLRWSGGIDRAPT